MARWLAVVVVVVALVMPFSLRAQGTATIRLAYVDLQKVMMESEKGKEAKKSLTDEADKLKKTLNQKQEELQKLKDSIERQGATMTAEARADKEKQYQAKLKDYQRIASDYQTELQQKDMDFTTKILKELEEIIKGMGEAEKFTLILEKSQAGILFATPSIDITDRVITRYNEATKKKAAAPAKK
jgi:outer membrane protein